MRKALFLVLPILALFCVPVRAQTNREYIAPDCEFGFDFTASGSTVRAPANLIATGVAGFDNRQAGCLTWTIVYQSTGFSAVSLTFQSAPLASLSEAPGTFVTFPSPAPGTIFPLTNTAGGQASAFGYQPYVAVLFGSSTGTGHVTGRVYGWKPQAGQDASQLGNSTVLVGYNYTPLAGTSNNQIKATAGTLHLIDIGSGTATLTIVDTTAANCTGGTTILTTGATAAGQTYNFDVVFNNGLCITTSAATGSVVAWR